MKDTDHSTRHPRVHLADRASTQRARGCRHELLQKNPISLVRQSAKRNKTPDDLDGRRTEEASR